MLTVHLIMLVCTVAVILYTDHLGFQYFRGIQRTLNPALVFRLHYVVWAGLLGMIATGAYMAYPAIDVLLAQPLFIAKMVFVLLLIINATAIGFLISVATRVPYSELTLVQKAPLLLSGAVSSLSWAGAVLVALFFFGNVFAWLEITL